MQFECDDYWWSVPYEFVNLVWNLCLSYWMFVVSMICFDDLKIQKYGRMYGYELVVIKWNCVFICGLIWNVMMLTLECTVHVGKFWLCNAEFMMIL